MATRIGLRTASIILAMLLAFAMPTATFAHGGGGGGGHGGGGGGHGGGGFGGGGFHGGGGGGGFRGGSFGGGSFAGRGYSGFSGYSGARSFASPAVHSGQFGTAGGVGGNRGFNSFAGSGFNHGNMAFNHGNFGNFNGRYGDYFNHGFYGHHGFGYGGYGGYGFGFGGFWPSYGLWDSGWGYPYAYSLYDYYPYSDYTYDYSPYSQSSYDYSYPVAGSDYVADTAPQTVATVPPDQQQAASEAEQYYAEARDYFIQGDYANALRMGAHAEIDAPANAKVHELLSLALFASGKYGPAASEAHAAMAMGKIAEWSDLYAYYNDVNKYTTQLRALEKAASDNPKAAADHFLLGYHYLMTGARPNAQSEFAEAVELTPKDKLATHYLAELKANGPLTPPQITAPPQTATKPQSAATPQGQVR